MSDIAAKPTMLEKDAVLIAQQIYNLEATVEELPSERDQNFLLEELTGSRFVLKIANEKENREDLELQNLVLDRLQETVPWIPTPRLIPTHEGNEIGIYETKGITHLIRTLTYLEGQPLADLPKYVPEVASALGEKLGQMDTNLAPIKHPSLYRALPWNLKQAGQIVNQYKAEIKDINRRRIIECFLGRYESNIYPKLHSMRSGLIYNDANNYNILVKINEDDTPQISGFLDFGDIVHGPYIYEPAVASAYAMLDQPDPLDVAQAILTGFHRIFPLLEEEIDLFFDLIAIRLATSVVLSSVQQQKAPENEYLSISQIPAWELLERLIEIDPDTVADRFRKACGYRPLERKNTLPPKKLLRVREEVLGPSLSLSYQKPLKIVRGFGQYLYDESGRQYLDMVNNVAHVGHCHPEVVRAGQRQMSLLNTNTRYLHDYVVRYSQQLCELLPPPLSVCYFVCSGSEANELALRMAMTHTSRKGIVVVDGAYHGNTSALIDISPFKYKGPGGHGAPENVFEVPLPDRFRGIHRGTDPALGEKYASYVKNQIVKSSFEGMPAAAFIVESLPGCAGQICLPEGYLQAAFKTVRDAGGVCIADEVQVGFGRVGTHFWGFETQGAVPDIVTMGKPMGNGHPLAAVVTTPEIAQSFANGMEYFNTYGGNPVSSAIGLAVLDVIKKEELQENANEVGSYLIKRLTNLKERYPLIGDVRGSGLFIGLELVSDSKSLVPATIQARAIVEEMKERGVLLSTDGPFNNVIKIKPPIVFQMEDVDRMVSTLETVLQSRIS